MKRMNRIIFLILALTIMLALSACGGNGKNDNGNSSVESSSVSAPKTTAASGDVVTAELPSGWILVTGTDMLGMNEADFICHTEKYQVGDPYLQIEEYPQDLDAAKAILESGNTFGKYNGEKELVNGTWYLAENAAVAQISEKVFMVKGYECDFSSEDVQNILGSLQWKK